MDPDIKLASSSERAQSSPTHIFHAKVGREIARKRYRYLDLREQNQSLPNIRFDNPFRSNDISMKNRLKGAMFSADISKDLHYSPKLTIVDFERSRLSASGLVGTTDLNNIMNDSVSTITGKVSLKSTDTKTVDSIINKISKEASIELPEVANKLSEKSKDDAVTGIQISENDLYRKYVLSKDIASMEPKPFQVHSRIMGWKLTTQSRKRDILNAVTQASRNTPSLQEETAIYDTRGVLADIECQKKIQMRSIEAWEKTMARMVKARCAKPKYMAEIALQSINGVQNTLSTFYVDRMNIISSAKKQSRGNGDYNTDLCRTLSRHGIALDLEKLTRNAFNINEEECEFFCEKLILFICK